jgi:hypothetical protein
MQLSTTKNLRSWLACALSLAICGVWLVFFTRVPHLCLLAGLVLSGTNESRGQELFRERGQSVVMSYEDFQALINDRVKCKKELQVAWKDKIGGQDAFLLEFNGRPRDPKIVLVPPGKTIDVDRIDAAGVSVDIAGNGEYRRQMASAMIEALLASPGTLFSKGAPGKH